MRELFRIGHFSIHVFGVTIALGILVGLWIMMKEAKKKGLEADKILDTMTLWDKMLVVLVIAVSVAGMFLVSVIQANAEHS